MKMKNLGNPHHHILKHVHVETRVHAQLGEVVGQVAEFVVGQVRHGGLHHLRYPNYAALVQMQWELVVLLGPGYLSYWLVTSSALELKHLTLVAWRSQNFGIIPLSSKVHPLTSFVG